MISDDEEQDGEPFGLSLSECAEVMGVTKQRAHTIERGALAKIREQLADLEQEIELWER